MTTTPETAVQRCVKAYYEACDCEDPENTGLSDESWRRVRIAYRHAMPYLTPGPDSIDAFIACVTHGLIFQVFQPAEASKLLYAAQVAIGSRRARTEAARQQSKSESLPKPAAQLPLEPQPSPTPLPPGDNGEAASATLQLPAPLPLCPSAPPSTTPLPVPKNQVEALLAQLYAGQLPGEVSSGPLATPLRSKPSQAPPTPTPSFATNHHLAAAS